MMMIRLRLAIRGLTGDRPLGVDRQSHFEAAVVRLGCIHTTGDCKLQIETQRPEQHKTLLT